jgi:integrative and conjugative element protein (TIGR02256 family)
MRKQAGSDLSALDSDRILRISEKVIKIFKKYEQKEGCREAGGILLGNVAVDYVEITNVTVPNRFDLRNFCSFVRARIPAQLRINKSWKKSSGTTIYLGEWHTHREVDPTLSLDDRQMIAKVFKETKMEIDFLYLIIVGLNGKYWVGKQTSKGLTKVDDFEIRQS